MSEEKFDADAVSLEITPDEVDAYVEQAEKWLLEPRLLGEYLTKRVLVHAQILDRLIVEPLPGKHGLNALVRAQVGFVGLATKIAEAQARQAQLELARQELEARQREPKRIEGAVDAKETGRKSTVRPDRGSDKVGRAGKGAPTGGTPGVDRPLERAPVELADGPGHGRQAGGVDEG